MMHRRRQMHERTYQQPCPSAAHGVRNVHKTIFTSAALLLILVLLPLSKSWSDHWHVAASPHSPLVHSSPLAPTSPQARPSPDAPGDEVPLPEYEQVSHAHSTTATATVKTKPAQGLHSAVPHSKAQEPASHPQALSHVVAPSGDKHSSSNVPQASAEDDESILIEEAPASEQASAEELPLEELLQTGSTQATTATEQDAAATNQTSLARTMAIGLLGVLALAFAVLRWGLPWLAKQGLLPGAALGGVSNPAALGKVRQVLSLGPNRSIYLVEVGTKLLVLASLPNQLELLSELPLPAEGESLDGIAQDALMQLKAPVGRAAQGFKQPVAASSQLDGHNALASPSAKSNLPPSRPIPKRQNVPAPSQPLPAPAKAFKPSYPQAEHQPLATEASPQPRKAKAPPAPLQPEPLMIIPPSDPAIIQLTDYDDEF